MRSAALAVSMVLCFDAAVLAAGGDVKSTPGWLTDTFIISGHRAGGRVHAPDNSMPNIRFAIENRLTAIEVDLRLTSDGALILWHDASFPKTYVDPTAADGERIGTDKLSSEQVRRIRYSTTVGGRLWKDVKVVFADDMAKAAKGRINLHLDTKSVPAAKVIEFIRRHGLQREAMVMSGSLDYLEAVRAAEPDVCLEYADNTLGRRKVDGQWKWYPAAKQHELYHELMTKLAAAGVDALCTKGLTAAKVAICHDHGILVRTSAGHMKVGVAPDRFLRMGVDYALTDDPLVLKQALRRLRPAAALSRPGQTLFDLVRGQRTRRE